MNYLITDFSIGNIFFLVRATINVGFLQQRVVEFFDILKLL